MSRTMQAVCNLELPLKSDACTALAQLLRSVTDLFVSEAGRHSATRITFFDDILCRLVQHAERAALVRLSGALAPVNTAPPRVVGTLARHDDIAVAGPLLRQSTRLQIDDLVEIANTQSQAHLLAIATRSSIAEAVTDVLAEKGDITVAKTTAGNPGARLSAGGITCLLARARHEHGLAELLASRVERSGDQVRRLALKAADSVRHQVIALAGLEAWGKIERVLFGISVDIEWAQAVERRDYSAAQSVVDEMRQDAALMRTALTSAANERAFEMTVVLIAALARTETRAVERLMASRDPGGTLLLCKAIELEWLTVRAILALHRCGKTDAPADLDRWCGQFSRIDAAIAQRVLQYWQARATLAACAGSPSTIAAAPLHDGENDWINWTIH